MFWFKKEPYISQILELWLTGNRISCRPIRSVIILVIKQIGLPLRRRPILLITRMITDRIGLHSVELPSLIEEMKLIVAPYQCWLQTNKYILYFRFPLISSGRKDVVCCMLFLDTTKAYKMHVTHQHIFASSRSVFKRHDFRAVKWLSWEYIIFDSLIRFHLRIL